MKQLELFDKPSKEELLASHMRSFRINFTYDELRAWHKKALYLTTLVRKANRVAPDEESSLAYQWYNR